jgi:hypothetical protein
MARADLRLAVAERGLQEDCDLDQLMLVEISAETLTNGAPNGH